MYAKDYVYAIINTDNYLALEMTTRPEHLQPLKTLYASPVG